MQIRTLLLVMTAGTLGWVARGKAEAPPPVQQVAVATPPPAPVIIRVAAPPPPAPEVDESDDADIDDAAGEDVGELLAKAKDQVAPLPPPPAQMPNGIHGRVSDERTGETLAGVTVILTGPAMQGSQTAITDEHGNYMIGAVPAGNYTATFYYADITVEQNNVTVSSFDSTPVFQRLDTSPPRLIEIPVPARTFESALGAAADPQNDPVGVSFSGGTYLENVYVVDGIELDQ